MVFHAKMRDTLPKVRFESIDADIHQTLKQFRVPLASRGIGEIDNSHSGLPKVPLPDIAVGTLDEIVVVDAFLEDTCTLTDVTIDPDADFDVVLFLYRSDIARGIGKGLAIEGEAAPIVSAPDLVSSNPASLKFALPFHPKTIEMQHANRAMPFFHAF